ncbi:MAG: Hsp70 family protein [Pirellulaceae bacterium]|jgi:molecular chaperone DnaK|nr:Hsp70 family protein [Pirellulaceae bacterium]MDP7017929.1 Hsp70 family protein [Pirellulaceae bacterium]
MSESGALVGIDLGTTQSVIAHLDANGVATTIPNADGDPLTASAIYLDGDNAIVGKAAKQAAAHHPDKVATFIKRYVGEGQYYRSVDGRVFRPETLSAIVLKKLKQDAEKRIGPISKAVITVPAFFDDTRRKATEDAGRIAGLDVLDIINEPTAAAIAYCLEGRLNSDSPAAVPDLQKGSPTVVVYDLGGGTFDVTVVQLSEKQFETIATDGEVQLGGKDWDDVIVDHLAAQFEEQHGFNPADDEINGPAWRESVANLAESTKKLLSQLPDAPLECFFQDKAVRSTMSRDELESLSRELVTRTQVVTGLVVRDQAGLAWKDIDRVLLVGGSTRMPMVRRMLEQVASKPPDDSLDPDQVVARGAAIYAAIRASQDADSEMLIDRHLASQLADVVIEDVNSHSLGVQTYDRQADKAKNSVLIPKNTALPNAASRVYHLNKAGRTHIRVRVLEGEAPEAEANITIGECRITDLSPNLPIGSPIQVRLSYGANGRVNVMALDMTGGGLAQVEIDRRAGLSDGHIRREAEWLASINVQ